MTRILDKPRYSSHPSEIRVSRTESSGGKTSNEQESATREPIFLPPRHPLSLHKTGGTAHGKTELGEGELPGEQVVRHGDKSVPRQCPLLTLVIRKMDISY